MEFNYLLLVPDWIFLELSQQNLVLLLILSKSFLLFLSAFLSVANHYFWEFKTLIAISSESTLRRTLICAHHIHSRLEMVHLLALETELTVHGF